MNAAKEKRQAHAKSQSRQEKPECGNEVVDASQCRLPWSCNLAASPLGVKTSTPAAWRENQRGGYSFLAALISR